MLISGYTGVWLLLILFPFSYNCASDNFIDCATQEHERMQELEEEMASFQRLLSSAVHELRSLEGRTHTWTQRFLETGMHV